MRVPQRRQAAPASRRGRSDRYRQPPAGRELEALEEPETEDGLAHERARRRASRQRLERRVLGERPPAEHDVPERRRLVGDAIAERGQLEDQWIRLDAVEPPDVLLRQRRSLCGRRAHPKGQRERMEQPSGVEERTSLREEADAGRANRAQGERRLAAARRDHHQHPALGPDEPEPVHTREST